MLELLLTKIYDCLQKFYLLLFKGRYNEIWEERPGNDKEAMYCIFMKNFDNNIKLH